jgi:hypothetical protein
MATILMHTSAQKLTDAVRDALRTAELNRSDVSFIWSTTYTITVKRGTPFREALIDGMGQMEHPPR